MALFKKIGIFFISVAAFGIAAFLGYRAGRFPTSLTAQQASSSNQFTILYSLDKKQNDYALIDVINNAHQYIYFAIYEFTKQNIADALISAKQRGVDVRGIADAEQSQTSYQAKIIQELRAAGISIETQKHPKGIMHIKALVTDNTYAIGSYNWTDAAIFYNDEILEIGTNDALRKQYEAIIQKILAANS